MKKIISVYTLALCISFSFAQNTMKTTALNIYKNGSYFIVKEGLMHADNNSLLLSPPPAPLLSTWWLTSTKDFLIKKIVVKTDTFHIQRNSATMDNLLESNVGKKVTITYSYDDKNIKTAKGVLESFNPMIASIARVTLTDGTTLFINSSRINDLIVEYAVNTKYKADSTAIAARVYFDKSGDIPLREVYMQSGIQWIPSYNIKLIDEKNLQLELKAVIENYKEPITGADLTLTVGAPQFTYGTETDPLASIWLSSLGISYANGGSTYAWSNSNYGSPSAAQSYIVNGSAADGVYDEAPAYTDYTTYSTEGEKASDLYMYKLGNVDLPINLKTSLPVFSAVVPYKDVYEVTIGDVCNYSYKGYLDNDPETRYDVYHSLEITNSTTNPFTTAPVFVLNEKLQPLAQDKISYTPIGTKVTVQLSKAGDVVVKNIEEETETIQNAKKIGGTSYRKVTIKGTLEIQNLQEKKITLSLKKYLNATILDASDSGDIHKSGKYSGLNPTTDIKWDLPLGSNDKKTVTYTYEVFVVN